MVCRYPSHSVAHLFMLIVPLSVRKRTSTFDEAPLVYFCYVGCAFGGIFKKSFSKPISGSVFLELSRSLTVLYLTFVFNPCQVKFCDRWKIGVQLHSLVCEYSVFPAQFIGYTLLGAFIFNPKRW